MQAVLKSFIESLILYDYLFFAGSFILFILFIILGLVYREKIYLAIFFVSLAFSFLIFGPIVGYIQIHNYFFHNEITIATQKKLQYTQAIVIKGELENLSKLHFKKCVVRGSAHKVSGNKYKDFLLSLNPFQTNQTLLYDIAQGEKVEFKFFIEPFVYTGDYNVTVEASCQ